MARPHLLLLATTATLVATTASISASAQEAAPFGERAQNVLVLDELFGFYRVTTYTPDAANSDETGGYVIGASFPGFEYGLTRFGYHRFLTPNLSLGTGLHYASYDVDLGFGATGKVTMLGLSPRIGFVFGGTSSGAFWLRVGGQYYHYDLGGSDQSAYLLGPGAEFFYVWTPHPHFGVMFGPSIELGLAGSEHAGGHTVCTPTGCTTTGNDTAFRSRVFGFGVGFLFDL